ncbi:MAG: hypothetical protein C4310_01545, partial [Chloroflexota bacterium]
MAALPEWGLETFRAWCERVIRLSTGDVKRRWAGIRLLTRLHDWRYATGPHKRSHVLAVLRAALDRLFETVPGFEDGVADADRRLTWETRERL